MTISVHIKKVGHGIVHIMADQRVLSIVRGEIFQTKEKKKISKWIFNDKIGRDEEKTIEQTIDGPNIDTLFEKTKCIVEWLNCEYKSEMYGPIVELKI